MSGFWFLYSRGNEIFSLKLSFISLCWASQWKPLTKLLLASTVGKKFLRLRKPVGIIVLFVLLLVMWMVRFLEIGVPLVRELCIRLLMRWKMGRSEFFFLVQNAGKNIGIRGQLMMKFQLYLLWLKIIVNISKKKDSLELAVLLYEHTQSLSNIYRIFNFSNSSSDFF